MNNLTNLKNTLSNNKSRFLSIQMTRKLAMSKSANWILCFCHIRVLAMGNSIKEAISIMKPKQIIISILAVLFVFPLMGTFAQQAPNAFSIEVITTFDYPGAGNSTLPQKINEKGDIVGEFIDANAVRRPLSGSAMVALVTRSSTLTIPWVLPKAEESITHAQSTVITSAAMVSFTRFSCRTAPSQNTMFPARSKPICFQ